jgi:UDP-N-acetylglucosamine 2-epimerase (hydrolysing)
MSIDRRKIVFITGTRADFGKLKPLIEAAGKMGQFELFIFVTGMHTLLKYGNTADEVYKAFPEIRMDNGFRNIFIFRNQNYGEPMEQIMANTIHGLSRYVSELKPDLIVVHGDRIEALAGAVVGSIRNILVAHIEGGEVSGTIDELLRHATSKMSHIHFVSNDNAAKRLKQLGEAPNSIFVVGSADIDLMLSPKLPQFEDVQKYYGVPFQNYGVVLFHPVTTNIEGTKHDAENLVDAILQLDQLNFVVIYPNNDEGSQLIFDAYTALNGRSNVILLPSMRVEYFFTLLKNSQFILGNSSAGIIEAPVYGIPTLNISDRQRNRHQSPSIKNISGRTAEIVEAIKTLHREPIKFIPDLSFGDGRSSERFVAALNESKMWGVPTQKQFNDMTD